MVDYPDLLAKLQESISRAVDNQEYHRLPELDLAVRSCVNKAVMASEGDSSARAAIAEQISDLMVTYKKVSKRCSEKSEELKSEFTKLKQSKRGASQYLSVAGKF